MSIWQLRAAVRYPRTAKRGSIFGDGQFVLVNACGGRPKVLLYPTAEARQQKLAQLAERGCGYGCMGDHTTFELSEE